MDYVDQLAVIAMGLTKFAPDFVKNDDFAEQNIVLLDHDTEWGRAFHTWLVSWGIDVMIGPHATVAGSLSLLVLSQMGFASEVVRDRLRVARALLPEAQLVLVMSPAFSIWPQPNCMTDTVDLRDLLRSVGISFVSDLCA